MAFRTLSYSQSTEGWPSFYSFNPEYMIGMNNFFIRLVVVTYLDTILLLFQEWSFMVFKDKVQ